MDALLLSLVGLAVAIVAGGSMRRNGTLSRNGYLALLGFFVAVAVAVALLVLLRHSRR